MCITTTAISAVSTLLFRRETNYATLEICLFLLFYALFWRTWVKAGTREDIFARYGLVDPR